MRWIDAKAKPPIKEEKYLVWVHGKWETARWFMNQWVFYKDILNREQPDVHYYLEITPPSEHGRIKKIEDMLKKLELMMTETDPCIENIWIEGKMYHIHESGKISPCED